MQHQTRSPETIIELSAAGLRGPQDLSRSLRSRLLQDRRQATRTTSQGPAGARVTSLWRHLERQLPDGFSPRHQWLWILPPGALPEPDTLEMLEERLYTVTDEDSHPRIQIIGAEQLHAPGPETPEDRLVDVGLFSARSGEVVSLTEPKERDQGQYDGRDAVPAVSAHGMLVHAPLFGDLGGFDPALPADYAAARFAQRAREVGAHVVVEPSARIRRADPPPREEVHRFGGSLHLRSSERRGQIRRRLADSPLLTLPVIWVGMWLAALLRTLTLTAVKAPDAAVAQLVASAGALLGWGSIAHTRSFARTGRRAALTRLHRDGRIASPQELVRDGRRADRGLRLSAAELRAHRRRLLTAETVAVQAAGFGASGYGASGQSGVSGEAVEDHAALLSVGAADGEFDEMPSRRSGDRLGLFLMLLALTGVSLLVFRELLTAEALTSQAALPAGGSIGVVFAASTTFVAPQGLGQLSVADPFNLVVLVLSGLSAGHASTVLVWLTVLALPLAALTGWLASAAVTRRATIRVVAGLLWAGVPALHIALGEGRLGSVIAHVLLPLVVLTAVRAVQGARPGVRGAGSWEQAAAAALLLAVLTAGAPMLLIPAVTVCVIGALVLGRRGRSLWLIPLPSAALAAPMVGAATLTGQNVLAVLLAGPSRAAATENAPLWQQLLGVSREFDPAAGLAGGGLHEYFSADFWSLRLALLIGAPLLLLALLGIVTATRRSTPVPTLLIGVALLGTLGFSAVVARLAVADDGVQRIAADVGPLVSLIVLCLLVAALGALDRLPRALPRVGPTITPVAATLLIFSVIASLGFWAIPRALPGTELTGQPLTAMTPTTASLAPGSVRQVPATAADQGLGPAQLRTLVLDSVEDGVVGELVSGQGRTVDSTRAMVSSGGAPLWAQTGDVPDWLGGGGAGAEAAGLTGGDQRLGQLIASLIAPGSSEVRPLMEELGIGYVLIDAAQGSSLVDAVDTAAGLTSVGPTDRGLLWRADTPDDETLRTAPGMAGAPTAWARLVDEDSTTLALVPSHGQQIEVELDELVDADREPLAADQDLFLQLATEQAPGWRAEVDGAELESAEPEGSDLLGQAEQDAGGTSAWAQSFRIPAEQWDQGGAAGEDGGIHGTLRAEHSSVYQAPVLILVGVFLLLVALIAIPLPRGVRLLPVASDAELAAMSGHDQPGAPSRGASAGMAPDEASPAEPVPAEPALAGTASSGGDRL